MVIQKDGKTYYTIDEVSQKLDKSIEKEAQNLLKKLQKQKKKDASVICYV